MWEIESHSVGMDLQDCASPLGRGVLSRAHLGWCQFLSAGILITAGIQDGYVDTTGWAD
jgi:hypothetical protein